MPNTTKTTKGKSTVKVAPARPRRPSPKPPRVPKLLPIEQVSVLPQLPFYDIPPDDKEADWLSCVVTSKVKNPEEILFEEPYIPFLKSSLDAWQKKSLLLAQRICDGDEKDLFSLIKHDPRYLMSPALIVKLMCWRLWIHIAREAPPSKLLAEKNAKSQANLRRLAEAVRFTSGRGNHNAIDRTRLLYEYEDAKHLVKLVVEDLSSRRSPLHKSTISALARRYFIDPEEIRKLECSPRSQKAVARDIVSRRFGIKPEHIRRRIREARAARVIPPPLDLGE